MKTLFNLVILLSIMSFGRYNFSNENGEKSIIRQTPINKGPVYNPLRVKPFIKVTANV